MNIIYNVSFPKMGITFQINPVALNVGSLSIKWYGIIIAIGFTLGFIYVLRRCGEFGIKVIDIENLTLISFISSIIFARIYYVVFYPGDFYIKNPVKIFCINEGGIAIYGAIIGGFIALLISSKVMKQNFFSVLDLMCLGLLIGQSIGRWGNFMNQEAFGTVTDLPWGMVSENTSGLAVHPCFLYESLGCMMCFLLLHVYSKVKKDYFPGKIFLLYILMYSILRVAIESLRTDSLIIPQTGLKVSQVLGIILSIVSLILLVLSKKKPSSL